MRWLCATIALLACGWGCGDRGAAGQPDPAVIEAAKAAIAAPVDEAARGEAQAIYDQRCRICHGVGGKGDGPGSMSLQPRPRDYTDQAWQRGATEEHLARVIIGGGAAVGMSALMPPNPDLRGRPAVVRALIERIRKFGAGG